MYFNTTHNGLNKNFIGIVLLVIISFFTTDAVSQNTVSGTVYNDIDGSARGTFFNIQTGAEMGSNANGMLNVFVVDTSNYILATAIVNADGRYTSSSYNASFYDVVYVFLDTLSRNVGDFVGDAFSTIKMPAAWANTSPYMSDDIENGGTDIVNHNFGIQKNGFLTIPDFSFCTDSDSLFTWYFRGAAVNLVNGTTVVENSAVSEKVPFLKVTAEYFTNNETYSIPPRIYAPSDYSIAGDGGLQPIATALEYNNPVLEVTGASVVNNADHDSIGISVVFKNTNGQKMYIQKLNNAVLDLDTYESLRVTGYNNGVAVKPLIYASNGYADNTTNDMRSFYMDNTAWIFGVSTGYQSTEPCSGWCDYNSNSVAIMEFATPVDSIFFTARIAEPTGNRGYHTSFIGSNEITGFKYCPVSIRGQLWNDANGNGIIDGSESSIINSGHYINLLDEYGQVLGTTQILADGTYAFVNLPQLGTSTPMKLQISATAGIIGNTPAVTTVPGGYVPVSENQGGVTETGAGANKEITLPLVLSSNLINYNFGIEKLPESDNKSASVSYPTGGIINTGSIAVAVSGYDEEEGILGNSNSIVITDLPMNAIMYYNNMAVSAGLLITGFDPALLSFSDIASGSTSVIFNYAFLDAASQQDHTPASYTINWVGVLPVDLEEFTATVKNCNTAILQWKIGNAGSLARFELEESTNAVDFKISKVIPFITATTSYSINENIFTPGAHYFRLKMIDAEGEIKYSQVASLRFDCKEKKSVLIYPNPAKDNITISGLNAAEQITMYNATGQVVQSRRATANQLILDIAKFSNGNYYIIVTSKIGTRIGEFKVVKIDSVVN